MGKVVVLSTGLLLGGGVSIPFASSSLDHVDAASIVKTSYQTTANLNMRAGAGTNYKSILTIPKGKIVTATERNGNWYRVSYIYSSKGKSVTQSGWVMGTYIKEIKSSSTTKPSSTASSTAKITKINYTTAENINLRTGAGTIYKTILTIPKGKIVTSSEKNGNWYKVTYTYSSKGKNVTQTGWVIGTYLKEIKSSSTTKPSGTASSAVKITKTNYTTATNINLRAGAGTNYKTVLTIPKGKVVSSSERQGDWYKITYTYSSKGKNISTTGWVSGSYLKEYYVYSNTGGTYYFTKKTVSLYSTPDTKNKSVSALAAGNGLYSTQKVVNSIGQTWYQVSYNGKNLYVISGDVTVAAVTSLSKTNYQIIKDAYLYASYGSAYSKLIRIPKDTIISSAKTIGNWYEVTYQGKKGYVQSSDLKSASQNTDNTDVLTEKNYLVTDNVNLRQSNSTSSTVLTIIPNGTSVKSAEETSNGWFKVNYNGKTGYVSGTYLKEYVKTDNYKFIDLRTASPVTASQINTYIANNVNGRPSILLNKGQVFIDAGRKYGVNALYLAAHAIHESGFGTSNISLGKMNLFGYGAYDSTPFVGAYRFSTVDDCIYYIAQKMKSDYLNPNGTHFEGAFLGYRTNFSNGTRDASNSIGMNYWYASDPNWANAIAQHMQKMLPYDKNYYLKAAINTKVTASPGIPAGGDKFPVNIQAIAKADLIPKTLPAGTSFIIFEKTNDYKIKVKVNGQEYWTSSIDFSRYQNYFSVLNFGRVTNSGKVNVRSTPEITANNIIGSVTLNNYIQLILDTDKKPIMDTSQKWFKIKLLNGKDGWISSQYVVKELQ
ncbi:SH3 domain-containing protein [Neobacillus drentensis]|uniref:SH3 domain-containing protein n=1 Tax=Neobacillus drentensis TaxID=220684 RepID=UPI002FFEF1BB